MWEVIEICGKESYYLDIFDERDDAEHFMIECAGNDVTYKYGLDILKDMNKYQELLTEALKSYSMIEV